MMLEPLFRDRFEAGRFVASRLRAAKPERDAIVLALPRGGVPVGFEVAQAFGLDLDVFVVRKLGVPGHEELAMGALASSGIRVLNQVLIRHLRISNAVVEQVTEAQRQELQHQEQIYRPGRPPLEVSSRTVILVDDGLATGSTMLAAVKALQPRNPKRVLVSVPVASEYACEDLRSRGIEVLCAETPEPFYAVGAWYDEFSPVTDEEVRELLARANRVRV
jgi:putative phosphoribosyl transferase